MMALPDLELPWSSSTGYSFSGCFDKQTDEANPANILHGLEVPSSSMSYYCDIPKPPPLPGKISRRARYPYDLPECCSVPKETVDTWDKIFKQGCGADIYIITDDASYIPAHSSLLVS